MAPLEIDGPYGLEALHTWAELDGTAVLTMGDRSAWPWYRLRDITGVFDLPPVDDIAEDTTEGIGAVPYPSRARSKNGGYALDVLGRTLQEMRAGAAALRQAFGCDLTTGLNPVRRMLITPQPYATPVFTYQARCLSAVPGGDKQERGRGAVPTAYVRSYVLGLRLYDPRLYVWEAGAQVRPQW